jgi:hypothetical protein
LQTWNFFTMPFFVGGLKSNAPKSVSSFLQKSQRGLIAMEVFYVLFFPLQDFFYRFLDALLSHAEMLDKFIGFA